MIKCAYCKTDKPISDYAKSQQNDKGRCRSCQSKLSKDHHKRNKEKYREASLRYRAKYQKIITEKKEVPCHDCGQNYPSYVMDFDHRNGEEKEFNVSHARAGGKTIEQLLEEINKCDVVCANCHRIRTFGSTQY